MKSALRIKCSFMYTLAAMGKLHMNFRPKSTFILYWGQRLRISKEPIIVQPWSIFYLDHNFFPRKCPIKTCVGKFANSSTEIYGILPSSFLNASDNINEYAGNRWKAGLVQNLMGKPYRFCSMVKMNINTPSWETVKAVSFYPQYWQKATAFYLVVSGCTLVRTIHEVTMLTSMERNRRDLQLLSRVLFSVRYG